MGDCERARREKVDSLENGFDVARVGEKVKVFSSAEAGQAFSMLDNGEDFVVGGGGMKFALREVRNGEGVWGLYEKESGEEAEEWRWWGVDNDVVVGV